MTGNTTKIRSEFHEKLVACGSRRTGDALERVMPRGALMRLRHPIADCGFR